MYGIHESNQSVEITTGEDEYRELDFQLDMKCVTRGDPGSFQGDDAYPPEAPEFELDSIHVFDTEGKPLFVEYNELVAILGNDTVQGMIDKATDDAIENGDFG